MYVHSNLDLIAVYTFFGLFIVRSKEPGAAVVSQCAMCRRLGRGGLAGIGWRFNVLHVCVC
jgi:hypothetical protein